MPEVIVLIGAGSIGQAIARRVSAGKHVVLADLRQPNVDAAAKVLSEAGFEVSGTLVDVSSRASVQALVEMATAIGPVTGVIHAAGPVASHTGDDPPRRSLRHRCRAGGIRQRDREGRLRRRDRVAVRSPPPCAHAGAEQGARHDTDGRAAFPSVPATGQSHRSAQRVPALQARQLAARDGRGRAVGKARSAREHDQPGHHHHSAREGRAHRPARGRLPPHAQSVSGRTRGYAGRSGNVAALLMGADGAFITGSDFLMDGGVTAAYWYGELAPQ